MEIEVYYSPSKDIHTIEFPKFKKIVAISQDKIQSVDSHYDDSELTELDATPYARVEALIGGEFNVNVTPVEWLFAVLDLKIQLG